jgi:hypothetical protein
MDDTERRQAAIKRVKAKRNFRTSLAVYVLVNAFLVLIWSFNGGYFWPIWPILGWGLGVALQGWDTYFRRPITEDDISREIAGRQ